MKYTIITCIWWALFLLSSHLLVAQVCLQDGINFSTQTEVDDFPVNYPNCKIILGPVCIGDCDTNILGVISSLAGLAQIESIQGDLLIDDNSAIKDLNGLNSLKSIGGSLHLIRTGCTTISSLGNLESIGQDFLVSNMNNLEDLSGLEKIDSIHGRLGIGFNPSTGSLSSLKGLDNLRYVGENLFLSKNAYLEDISALSNLEYIGGILGISGNALTSLDPLAKLTHMLSFSLSQNDHIQNIKGLAGVTSDLNDLSFTSTNALESLEGLENIGIINNSFTLEKNWKLKFLANFRRLTSVGTTFRILTNPFLENLDGLSQLSYIGGEIYMYDNLSVKQIDGLAGLESTGDECFFSSHPELTDINGFQSLTTVGGDMYLTDMGRTTSLEGLEKLTVVDGDLTIRANDNLENIMALKNLKSINGGLNISTNDVLSSLEGLEQLDPHSINKNNAQIDLTITSNPLLSDCAVYSICGALYQSIDREIENNAVGCNNESEINCSDYGISGNVFYDTNQNQTRDSLEYGIDRIGIGFIPTDNVALGNENGFYFQLGILGTEYQITPELGNVWSITTDSTSYRIPFERWGINNINKDFGLIYNSTQHNLEVNLISEPARCNTEVPFVIAYRNIGSEVESGKIDLRLDAQVSFISSEPAPASIAGNILSWNYDGLRQFEQQKIELVLQAPDETNTGNFINFTTSIERDSSGSFVPMASDFYETLVKCSFDPNDKAVTPQGVGVNNEVLVENLDMDYTIRFQNTGNDVAIDVSIRDTIDTDLDMETFEVTASSHEVQTYIYGNAIEFLFKDIYLIDSLSNEPESHGYIRYKIVANDNISLGTTIHNTAHIFFDQNAAIVTNTTLNTFVDKYTSSVNPDQLRPFDVYPNPADEVVQILIDSGQFMEAYKIYDNTGLLVKSGYNKTVDCIDIVPGIYNIVVELKAGVFVKRFVILR